MSRAATRTRTAEEFIEEICARSVSAELHYEATSGAMVIARVRLVSAGPKRILADKPVYADQGETIPVGRSILVHLSLGGNRYQFESSILDDQIRIPLNSRQRVSGIALQRPSAVEESQRRAHVRVSMAGTDPIAVQLVCAHPKVRDACAIDATHHEGRIVNLSAGGVAVLASKEAFRQAKRGDRVFLTFVLPGADEEFLMMGSLRHVREVESSGSVRISFAFRPWGGLPLPYDQRRIQHFIVDQERQTLRRRR